MKLRHQLACWACVAAVAAGVAHTGRLTAAPAASTARLWLELEPERFQAQATVVDLLWLQGLSQQLSTPKQPPKSRFGVLFAETAAVWQHATHVQPSRPEEFQPLALRELVDLGGPARLFWRAADVAEPATLLQMIGNLEQIWGEGMQAAVSDYAAAFEMLGEFQYATAEIREAQGRLTGRLVLVAASESDAKRASAALTLASSLGRMVSAGAVRSGQMSAEAGAALASVLGSIETRVDGARLTVHLGIDVLTLREVMP